MGVVFGWAENLAKAACVCNRVVHGEEITLKYPRYTDDIPVTDWVDMVMDGNCSDIDVTRAINYKYESLGDYWNCYLPKLCEKKEVCSKKTRHVKASYKYLTAVIRNRDVHTYIPAERRRDFPAVQPIFVPAFNTLVETMKKNQHFDS